MSSLIGQSVAGWGSCRSMAGETWGTTPRAGLPIRPDRHHAGVVGISLRAVLPVQGGPLVPAPETAS